MKISRQWLEDFVDLTEFSDERLEELITTRVAEVEGVELSAEPLAHAVVARVLKVERHPESKKLSLVTIDNGSDQRQVVCGASNVCDGLITAFVAPGGIVSDGKGGKFEISVRKVAGVESPGILVSASELDIAPDGEGIIELDEKLKAGTPLTEIFGEPDTVFEIDNKSLTHRPDLWGHYGFARELSAITGSKLKLVLDEYSDATAKGKQKLEELRGAASTHWSVEIEENSGCARFSTAGLSHVKVEPSPARIVRRLHAVGAGVRNLVVDLSNYVMLETGQPNHTYDSEKLQGKKILVRKASGKEKFKALDDNSYSLSKEDVVIADESFAVALGGIIGGGPSAVSEETTELLIESANFDPVQIRKTGKRLALRTDASNRFEKGRTPWAVPLATLRYIELLKEIQPQVKISNGWSEAFSEKPEPVKIAVREGYISERLGSEMSQSGVDNILTSLGFECKPSSKEDGKIEYSVPWYRPERDISIPMDLVEEVGRISGYENIPERAPEIASSASRRSEIKQLEYQIADLLRGAGFSQYESESFVSAETEAELGYPDGVDIRVKNAVDVNQDKMRESLAAGMIEAVKFNKRFSGQGLLFELGRVYRKSGSAEEPECRAKYKNSPAEESRRLGVVLYHDSKQAADGQLFYQAAELAGRIVSLVSPCEPEIAAVSESGQFPSFRDWMHPYRAARVSVEGTGIAEIAEVSPEKVDGARACLIELDTEWLLEKKSDRAFSEIPRFPESFFEVSIVASEREEFSTIAEVLRKAAPKDLLKGLELVSVYQGDPIPADRKSVSVKLMFGADDRTLSGEELEKLQQAVIKGIEKSSYELRS